MNSKRAKALRQLAHAMSEPGAPWSVYVAKIDKIIRTVTNPNHEKFGETLQVDMPRAVLKPGSTKAIYKQLVRVMELIPTHQIEAAVRAYDRERISERERDGNRGLTVDRSGEETPIS